MSEPTNKPEIESDPPESPELPAETGPASAPALTKSMLDVAALAVAQAPPALRLFEQEQKRIERMEELMSGGAVQTAITRMIDRDNAIARAMAGLDTPLVTQTLRDIERLTAPLAQMQAFQSSSLYDRLVVDAEKARALHRSAVGPLADLRASGALNLLEDARTAGALASALRDYEGRFVLPDALALNALINQAAGLAPHLNLQKLAASMHYPWLDTMAEMRSMTGFAEMQALGMTVTTLPPYDVASALNVRMALGDWRDAMIWPDALDLTARSAFYVERGFRTELTDFPAAAFEESLDLAGLDEDPASETPDPDYAAFHEAGDGAEWSAFVRTNKAHMRLSVFEAWLRHFIDTHLTAAFGPDWPKHKLPNGMHDEWIDRRERAEKRGARPRPIIAYADFTEYSVILTKKDLWPIFAPFFGTQESVRESFNRLYLPRLEVAHARQLSQDDELYLRVEIMRLGRAIKLRQS